LYYGPFANQYSLSAGESYFVGGQVNPQPPTPYSTTLTPLPRDSAMHWTDLDGNLWLFGGFSSTMNMLDDFWKFNVFTNEWENILYNSSYYSNPPTRPSARIGSACWRDAAGSFWLFGGMIDSNNGV
jgi:Galactose oxidase, central domain